MSSRNISAKMERVKQQASIKYLRLRQMWFIAIWWYDGDFKCVKKSCENEHADVASETVITQKNSWSCASGQASDD